MMGWIGRKVGRCLKRPTSIARDNLKTAFPLKSQGEIEAIITDMWDNLGRILPDYAFFYSMNIYDAHRFEIKGQEHLQALINDDKPGILVAGHLANWGIVSLATVQGGLPLTQIYRRFNNPVFDWFAQKTQLQGGIKVLWKGAEGGKEAYKSLKNGEHLVIFIDQKMKEGIPVPFFGRDAMTAPAAARLALKLNCPIVPVRVERLKGIKFRVTYYPPISISSSNDTHQDIATIMVQINKLLESWIRESPGQWLWVHNRWPKKK